MKDRLRDMSVIGSVIFFMVTIPIYIYLKLYVVLDNPQVVYCLPDAYIYEQLTAVWLIFPVMGIVYINALKHDFSINQIIRRGNLKRIWINLIKDIFVTSLLAGVYIFVWTTIWGLLLTDKVQCNWNSLDSNAYYTLRIQVDTFVDFRVMMVVSFVVTFLMLFCIGLFIVITWWVFNTPVVGYMTMVALMMVELTISPAPIVIFFAKIIGSFYDTYLYYNGLDYFSTCVYPALFAIVLIVLGFILIRRKDFLKKE